MVVNKTTQIAGFYGNDHKRLEFIRELGITGLLEALKSVLTELEEATIFELTTPEYDPKTYNQQIAIIREAKRVANHVSALQASFMAVYYAYSAGLSKEILERALSDMERKTNELVITSQTMNHWKALVVLLDSIEYFYFLRDDNYQHPQDSTAHLQLQLSAMKVSSDSVAVKEVYGVTGETFARSCQAVATKLKDKIAQYRPFNLVSSARPEAVRGVPIAALDTVDQQPELSKIKGLESLLSDHTLSREQNGRLAVVRMEVITALKAYLASSSMLWSPPNAALVNAMLAYFDVEFDPMLQLKKLLVFRSQLTEARSVNLLPRVNDILVAAYNLLRITDARSEEGQRPPLRLLSSSNAS